MNNNEELTILNIENNSVFNGSLKDFLEQVNRGKSYKSIKELEQKDWFNNHYKLILDKTEYTKELHENFLPLNSEVIHEIYDIKNKTIFSGTLKEFLIYANRGKFYKTIAEVKKRKWFKQGYRIITDKNRNKYNLENIKISNGEKTYKIFDKSKDFVFVGTFKEFVDYIDKGKSYKTLKEIRERKWFKKNYKIIVERKRKPIDENSTYIAKSNGHKNKCSNCIRRGFAYINECEVCYVKTPECYSKLEFNNLLSQNPKIEPLSNFINKSTPIKFKCRVCGYCFDKMPKDVIDGVFCSNCASSKGEQSVAMVLDKYNIKYIKEKTFPNLKYKKPLRFDFYLPKYNALIEYDGLQHYRPATFFNEDYDSALESFKSQRKRDELKNSYCKKYKIKLLRIRYDENNIEKRILEFLKINPFKI